MSKALKAAIEADDAEGARKAIKGIKDLNRKLPGAETPVVYAAQKNAAKVLGELLRAGVEVKGGDGYVGWHPFVEAASHAAFGAMKALSGHATGEVLEYALQEAGSKGREEVVAFLLKEFECARVLTPKLARIMVNSRKAGIVRMLKEAGVDFNAAEEKENGRRLLHSVMFHGDSALIRALVECGADVNGRDGFGRTALMELGEKGVEMPERRAREAARRAMDAKHGKTPKADATPFDEKESIRTLVALGADAGAKDADGNDALDYYWMNAWQKRVAPDAEVVEILRKAGATGSDAFWKLHVRLREKDVAGVREAIASGADVNRVVPMGWGSAMTAAAGSGNMELLEAVIAGGGDVNRADRMRTPLMAAAENGDVAAVKRLVELGAGLEALEPRVAEEREARNAYMMAEDRGKHEVVAYLKSKGGGRAKVMRWKPLEAGVSSWNDFSEVLVKGDAGPVGRALAKMVGGGAEGDVYGKEVKVGERGAYLVAKPKGMVWCNVMQVEPETRRFEERKVVERFGKELAEQCGSEVISLQYSDTSDAVEILRFGAGGEVWRDEGWDKGSLEEAVGALGAKAPEWMKKKLKEAQAGGKEGTASTERLKRMAVEEKFVVAGLYFRYSEGRAMEVGFTGLPAEAFDGVVFVTT